MNLRAISLTACLFSLPVIGSARSPVFPYGVPTDEPHMPLSKAMERAYTDYSSPTTWGNELFTKFPLNPVLNSGHETGYSLSKKGLLRS